MVNTHERVSQLEWIKKQSDLGLDCVSFCLHHMDTVFLVKPHDCNFIYLQQFLQMSDFSFFLG